MSHCVSKFSLTNAKRSKFETVLPQPNLAQQFEWLNSTVVYANNRWIFAMSTQLSLKFCKTRPLHHYTVEKLNSLLGVRDAHQSYLIPQVQKAACHMFIPALGTTMENRGGRSQAGPPACTFSKQQDVSSRIPLRPATVFEEALLQALEYSLLFSVHSP